MFGNAPHNASVGNPALRRVNDEEGWAFDAVDAFLRVWEVRFVDELGDRDRAGVCEPEPGRTGAKYSLLSKLIALQIGYAMFSELQRRYRYI